MTNDKATDVTVEPCPFCGSSQTTIAPGFAEFDDKPKWAAICKACGAEICRDTEAEAVAAWNHRTASEQPASGEVIEAAAWIVGDSSGTRWRTWSALGPDWTEDREKATRYARREDAEQVHEADDEAWRVQRYIEPALSTTSEAPEAGRLREALEPWPGCYADLQRRRVSTLAKLGLMLSIMASGEAAEVVGYDADELYAEVLMALAIEDAEDTDIALGVARDHPDGDILVRAGK